MSSSAVRRLDAHESSLLRASCALPRFAAIVEELLLNSLDAGATAITASMDVRALTIAIHDDGCGITERDLRLIGERHVTSKLSSLSQLEQGVRTFGFRGEALHCIAAISHLEVVSCAAATPHTTSAAVLHHGSLVFHGAARETRAIGTSVRISDCFATRPVARKQLMRPGAAGAEAEHTRKRLAAISLAHPSVSIRLVDASCHTTLLSAPRASSILGSLRQLVGNLQLPALVPFQLADDDGGGGSSGSSSGDGGSSAGSSGDGRGSSWNGGGNSGGSRSVSDLGLELEGYVAMPPAGVRSRDVQLLFLNRRPLASRSDLHKLVESAFNALHAALMPRSGGRLPTGPVSTPAMQHHAAFVLFLSCAPHHFDLTLEPDKSEAIFTDGGRAVEVFVLRALGRLFVAHCEGRLSAAAVDRMLQPLAPRSAVSAWVAGGGGVGAGDGGGDGGGKCAGVLHLAPGGASRRRTSAPRLSYAPTALITSAALGEDALDYGAADSADGGLFDTSMLLRAAASRETSSTLSSAARRALDSAPLGSAAAIGAGFAAASSSSISRTVSRERLAAMSALGQVDRKFIVATAARMLYIFDQHAADERVQLEKLLRATIDSQGMPLRGGVEQVRVRPATRLAPSSHELALLSLYSSRLCAWGWELRDAGSTMPGTMLLECVPSIQSVELHQAAMIEYAEALHATGGGSTLAPPAVLRVLASKACRRAVMFGDSLSLPRCQHILTQLATCDLPFQCAHGRPTLAPMLDLDALPVPLAKVA